MNGLLHIRKLVERRRVEIALLAVGFVSLSLDLDLDVVELPVPGRVDRVAEDIIVARDVLDASGVRGVIIDVVIKDRNFLFSRGMESPASGSELTPPLMKS
jgi:hypothetical protein